MNQEMEFKKYCSAVQQSETGGDDGENEIPVRIWDSLLWISCLSGRA